MTVSSLQRLDNELCPSTLNVVYFTVYFTLFSLENTHLLVRRISYGVEHTRHLRSADSSSLKLSTSHRRRHS
jgi:hypothetical protein